MKRCPSQCGIDPLILFVNANKFCTKCGAELEDVPDSRWICNNPACQMFNIERIFLESLKYCGECGLELILIED